MHSKIRQALLAICMPLLPLGTARGAIIEVSIPVGSQNPLCRPSYDNIWTVTAPPFPFGVNSGIGIIVQPSYTPSNDNHDFALHQNDGIQPSPLYVAPNVPDPATVTITYVFDQPEIVNGVEIIQHYNGITKVEGFLGNSTNSLVSLGAVFGPSGDITDGSPVAPDGTSQVFDFGNTNISGTILQVIVRKTSFPNAFATHRIYPLANAARICNASGPPIATIQVSQVQICWNSDCDKMYQVQYSSDLTTNTWVNLGSPIQGNGSTSCVTDSTIGQPHKFYQVILLP